MNNQKILLVEDDLFLRDLYEEILKDAGFTVLIAKDGQEGLDLGKQHQDIQLVLLDILLPKIHGIDVLKAFKSNSQTKHIPIVIFSNLTQESVTNEALRLGAFAYLVKVRYTPEQVVEKVNEFIQFHNRH